MEPVPPGLLILPVPEEPLPPIREGPPVEPVPPVGVPVPPVPPEPPLEGGVDEVPPVPEDEPLSVVPELAVSGVATAAAGVSNALPRMDGSSII